MAREGIQALIEFLNSGHSTADEEVLPSGVGLTHWVRSFFPSIGGEFSDEEAARARRFRTALQEFMFARIDGSPDAATVSSLRKFAERATLKIDFREHGEAELVPRSHGVDAVFAQCLGLLARLDAGELSGPFKKCDGCHWVYIDKSKNRSRRWCGIGCADKAKSQAYRDRKRTRASS